MNVKCKEICDIVWLALQNLIHACRDAARKRIRSCRDCGVPVLSQAEVDHGGIHFGHMIRECYPCPYCSKLFTNIYNLRGHLSHHTGIKEFRCPVCGSEHSLKHNFVNHLTKIHGITLDATAYRSRAARRQPQVLPEQSDTGFNSSSKLAPNNWRKTAVQTRPRHSCQNFSCS